MRNRCEFGCLLPGRGLERGSWEECWTWTISWWVAFQMQFFCRNSHCQTVAQHIFDDSAHRGSLEDFGCTFKVGMRGLQRKEVKTISDTSRQYKYCLPESLKTYWAIRTAAIPRAQLTSHTWLYVVSALFYTFACVWLNLLLRDTDNEHVRLGCWSCCCGSLLSSSFRVSA